MGNELILYHLTGKYEDKHVTHRSSFVALLGDVRAASGRDANGKKEPKHHGNWLAIIGYLILLDQIGDTFAIKGKTPSEGNAIYRALGTFSSLGKRERKAIYALRCSLAHEYSLFNIPPLRRGKRDPELFHLFNLCQGSRGNIVTLPEKKWDGKHSNLDSITTVNVELLGDLVEDIVQKLITYAHKDELEIILPGGLEEFAMRFSIWAPKHYP